MLPFLLLLVKLFSWVAFSYVMMSFIEYVLHRWPMHSRAFARRVWWLPLLKDEVYRHAYLHHSVYFPRRHFDDCNDPASRYISISLSPFFNLLGLSPIWIGLYFVSPLGAAIFAGFAALHAVLWTAIHREMHEPANRWFACLRIYRFWRTYHETHHRRPNFNFNVVCPLMDHVFGTYIRPENGPIM